MAGFVDDLEVWYYAAELVIVISTVVAHMVVRNVDGGAVGFVEYMCGVFVGLL